MRSIFRTCSIHIHSFFFPKSFFFFKTSNQKHFTMQNQESENSDETLTIQNLQKQSIQQGLIHDSNIDLVIKNLEKTISESDSFKEDNYITLGASYLAIGMPNKAAEIFQTVIKKNRFSSIAYLFEGVAYLWMGKDDAALAIWKDGMSIGGLYAHFALMSNLVNDANFRTHLFTKRFDINELFRILRAWDTVKSYTDNDVREGFKEICESAVTLGNTHFTQILAVDPKNYCARLGRGIGYCLTGQWQAAIDDLNIFIDMEDDASDTEPVSYQEYGYRFRSIAHAALGQFALAVCDITKVIVRFPNDYESVLLRSKYLIKQRLYKQACHDILTVPPEHMSSKDWVSFAHCLYEIGDSKEALEALAKTDQKDEKRFYLYYLVYRDIGHPDLALKNLLSALELMPSPLMQRSLADFFLEIGKPDKAIPLYEHIYTKCPGDVSCMRNWAISLFETGNLKDAAKVIIPFTELTGIQGIQMYQEHEHPQLKLDGELLYSSKSLIGKNLMEKIYRDRILILDTIANLNNPLSAMSSTAFLGHRMINSPEVDYSKVEIPPFLATQQETQMVIDADRLGSKCIHRGFETIHYNQRIIRALGFSILLFASLFRQKDIKNRSQLMLELFQKLMSLADPLSDIEANNLDKQGGTDISFAPTYYFVRGHRESPRFEGAVPAAVQRLIKQIHEVNPSKILLPFVNPKSFKSYTDVYAAIQKNITVNTTWKLSGPSVDNKEYEFKSPQIVLQSLGALGFNFFLRPQYDMESWAYANEIISTLINKIACDTENDTIPELAALVAIIWTRQPLTTYSPELGHVLIHAYAIAKQKTELSEYYFGFAEEFILQMIEPDQARLERLLRSHFTNNQIVPVYNEESVSYWTQDNPTVNRIISLFNLVSDI